MTQRQIAQLIPAEYRKEILATNMISQAIASSGDSGMVYLSGIWKTYISPDENITCGLCLERILGNYRQLQPMLLELEKENNLLESL
jgi:hypothetical protein